MNILESKIADRSIAMTKNEYVINLVGQSKSGKSRFVAACIDDPLIAEQIHSSNTTGKTKGTFVTS